MTTSNQIFSLLFAALAVITTAFCIMYSGGAVESTVISYVTFASLTFAFTAGCFGVLKPAREDQIDEGFNLALCVRYFGIKSASVMVAMVAFEAGEFSFAYAGVIESTITTIAAILSLFLAFLAGFMGCYELEAPAQHQHASSRG